MGSQEGLRGAWSRSGPGCSPTPPAPTDWGRWVGGLFAAERYRRSGNELGPGPDRWLGGPLRNEARGPSGLLQPRHMGRSVSGGAAPISHKT